MTSTTNTATRRNKRTGRIGVMSAKWFEAMSKTRDKVFHVRSTVPNMAPVRQFVLPLDFSL